MVELKSVKVIHFTVLDVVRNGSKSIKSILQIILQMSYTQPRLYFTVLYVVYFTVLDVVRNGS